MRTQTPVRALCPGMLWCKRYIMQPRWGAHQKGAVQYTAVASRAGMHLGERAGVGGAELPPAAEASPAGRKQHSKCVVGPNDNAKKRHAPPPAPTAPRAMSSAVSSRGTSDALRAAQGSVARRLACGAIETHHAPRVLLGAGKCKADSPCRDANRPATESSSKRAPEEGLAECHRNWCSGE